MSERKVVLTDLAGRVSDGTLVDWAEAERSASSEEERRVVRRLRLIESVASVHRGQETSPSARDPLEMSASVNTSTVTESVTIRSEASTRSTEDRRWGHLEIRQRIGEGAFGEVFRAWDPNLEVEVALKLLKKEPSTRDSLASAVLEEGRLLARVRHPNVVTVFGADRHDERVGLWMEFVRGRSLAEQHADRTGNAIRTHQVHSTVTVKVTRKCGIVPITIQGENPFVSGE